jgi:hypothetical protein
MQIESKAFYGFQPCVPQTAISRSLWNLSSFYFITKIIRNKHSAKVQETAISLEFVFISEFID